LVEGDIGKGEEFCFVPGASRYWFGIKKLIVDQMVTSNECGAKERSSALDQSAGFDGVYANNKNKSGHKKHC
jgi:hypothetical protein